MRHGTIEAWIDFQRHQAEHGHWRTLDRVIGHLMPSRRPEQKLNQRAAPG